MSMYKCPCGAAFAEKLGAYGCPNCLGDSGPASISDGSNIRTFYNRRLVTREEARRMFPAAYLTTDGANHGSQE